jgi:hypothetical protein
MESTRPLEAEEYALDMIHDNGCLADGYTQSVRLMFMVIARSGLTMVPRMGDWMVE